MVLRSGLAAAFGLLCLTGARTAAQVESRAELAGTWGVAFAFGAGTPDLPHVGSVDLERHPAATRRFTALGVASPGGHALLAGWLGWKTRPARVRQRGSGFIGVGPVIEMGNIDVRFAGGARVGREWRISPGVRIRIEVRGLVFAADRGAGRGALLALAGVRTGGG